MERDYDEDAFCCMIYLFKKYVCERNIDYLFILRENADAQNT